MLSAIKYLTEYNFLAPTAPRDVTGVVLSPVLARVTWTPDPGLWYELHWRTEDASLQHNFKGNIISNNLQTLEVFY